MTSPTQAALRELMILTKCYCDGEHPRLGHNCSFRPDVLTLVANISAALEACDTALVDGGSPEEIRRALLGLPVNEHASAAYPGGMGVPDEPIEMALSMTRDPGCERCNYDMHRCHGCGTPLPHGIEACDECNRAGQPTEGPVERLPGEGLAYSARVASVLQQAHEDRIRQTGEARPPTG